MRIRWVVIAFLSRYKFYYLSLLICFSFSFLAGWCVGGFLPFHKTVPLLIWYMFIYFLFTTTKTYSELS